MVSQLLSPQQWLCFVNRRMCQLFPPIVKLVITEIPIPTEGLLV
jgi:hypothetical protein